MLQQEMEISRRTVQTEANAPHRAFGGFGTARVIRAGQKQVLLDRTPLSPSKPCCAGDQGTVNGTLVVDVVEEAGGFLHVMDEHLELKPGDKVRVWRDPIRRDRQEFAHTAAVVCQAELSRKGVAVVSVEIAAGMAWVEIAGSVPHLDLRRAIKANQKIEILGRRAGRMAVFLEDRIIDTVDAPIATRTANITGAEVTAIAAHDAGHAAIEIALPDEHGRRWWR